MTTSGIDWLESGYFYMDENKKWKYKEGTPRYLIKQYNNFIKVQSKLYGNIK